MLSSGITFLYVVMRLAAKIVNNCLLSGEDLIGATLSDALCVCVLREIFTSAVLHHGIPIYHDTIYWCQEKAKLVNRRGYNECPDSSR